MTAIAAVMAVVHFDLCCRRRCMVMATERHAACGKSLQREPQQQKAEDKFA